MTRMPRILVATATYNERESLPYLFEAIQASVPTVDILVVDDNSPDGTGQWVDEQAANDPRIRVIHRSGKLGLGTATIAAFQYAIDQDYEFLVALDADGSHDPARFLRCSSKLKLARLRRMWSLARDTFLVAVRKAGPCTVDG